MSTQFPTHANGARRRGIYILAMLVALVASAWGNGSDKEENLLRSLGPVIDLERESRYSAIYEALQINSVLKLTLLDEVLPLPQPSFHPGPASTAPSSPNRTPLPLTETARSMLCP